MNRTSFLSLMIIGIELLSGVPSVQALPSNCDATVSGFQTFASLQALLDGQADVGQDGRITICLADNARITNYASFPEAALKVRRDNISLVADPGSRALIKSEVALSNNLHKNSLLFVQRDKYNEVVAGFSAKNINFETTGEYGVALFINNAVVGELTGLSFNIKGLYGTAIRLETFGIPNFKAQISKVSDARFYLSNTGTDGVEVVRAGIISEMSNLSITISRQNSTAVIAYGLHAGLIKNLTINMPSDNVRPPFSVFDNSEIGELTDVTITGTKGGGIDAFDSKLGLVQRISISSGAPSSTSPYPMVFSGSSVGGIRKVTITGYASNIKPVTVLSSGSTRPARLGFSSHIKNGGTCVAPYVIGLSSDEPFQGC